MNSTNEHITENIQELQSDILLEDLSSNTLFKYSALPSKNKKLDTTRQNVIQAINEIKSSQTSLITTVNNNLNKQFEAIGDVVASADVKSKLQALGTNMVTALYNAKNQIANLETKTDVTNKDIVFVIPKINPNTKMPEIYFPYNGKIKKIVASISPTDNYGRDTEDAEIEIAFEAYISEIWTELTSITIPRNRTYASKNIVDYLAVNSKQTRVKIKDKPDTDLFNLSVVVSLETNNE